jgi:hypothetical protein
MTIKAFKAKVLKLGGSILAEEKFSTLNAWGFDGMYGTRLTVELDGVKLFYEHGRVSTRHQGTFPEWRVKVGDLPTCSVMVGVNQFFDWFKEGARTMEEFRDRKANG